MDSGGSFSVSRDSAPNFAEGSLFRLVVVWRVRV